MTKEKGGRSRAPSWSPWANLQLCKPSGNFCSPGERLFVFLDDVHVVTTPDWVGSFTKSSKRSSSAGVAVPVVHDAAWDWPVLGVGTPRRAQPGWAPAESAAVIAFHRKHAAGQREEVVQSLRRRRRRSGAGGWQGRLRELQSSRGEVGPTCSTAFSHSKIGASLPELDCALFPNCILASVGSRCLIVVHVLGVAEV